MGSIKEIRLVESSKAADYQEALRLAVDDLHSMVYYVEVRPSMIQAHTRVGYMYSAVVTGRAAS